MDYKLAKELKEAGFPQAADEKGTLRKGGSYLFPEGMTLATPKKKFDAAISYAPTLEELIEACNNLTVLRKTAPERGKLSARWIAEAWPYMLDVHTSQVQAIGDTPTEAVARLWLALQRAKTETETNKL